MPTPVTYEVERTMPEFVEILIAGGDMRCVGSLVADLITKYGKERRYFYTDLDGEYKELCHSDGKYTGTRGARCNDRTGLPVLAAKGEKGGVCNREACDIVPAIFFNQTMNAHYCAKCARKINMYAERDLCVLVPDHSEFL